MKSILNPQEIYLLERYISAEYFCELRDTWSQMVAHVESCLDSFMRNLPKDYRKRSLPEQPDIVWGHRVLPNFRSTLQGLNTGFIMLTHGDFKGLSYAWGPKSDFKGQMDFWSGWMVREDENLYGELLHKAVVMASNISTTERAGWEPLELSQYGDYLGPLNPPERWPIYKLDKGVSVVTGDKFERSGIYMPDVENSCSEFLSTSYSVAPTAKVLVRIEPVLDPTTGEKYDEERIFEERNCIWYLVERGAETDVFSEATYSSLQKTGRLEAGEVCPETGFYFTPATPEARRLFKKGEIMPDMVSEYGHTIWQRDGD